MIFPNLPHPFSQISVLMSMPQISAGMVILYDVENIEK